MTVLPGGTVTALGGIGPAAPPWPSSMSFGAHGYIRRDSFGAPPTIQGAVVPTPTALELPHLRSVTQARIGTTWTFDVFAPENAAVFAAASPIQGGGTATPFGPLGIDVPSASILAYAAIAPSGHDPVVSVPTAVPNAPPLVGLTFWIQALVFPPALPGRLSNTLAVAVQ